MSWQDGDIREAYAEELRAWAKGVHHTMAATELLIRGFDGSFLNPGYPWMEVNGSDGMPWINFEVIPEHIGAKSGGERRFLLVVASIASSQVDVCLWEALSMDKKHTELVVSAVAHASGFGELYPWPA